MTAPIEGDEEELHGQATNPTRRDWSVPTSRYEKRRGRDDVDLALVVDELEELGVRLERGRDHLLDLGRGLRGLEAELTGAVGDTDANVHVWCLSNA